MRYPFAFVVDWSSFMQTELGLWDVGAQRRSQKSRAAEV